MTNSADPDQLASSKANRSGSTLFAKTGHIVFSNRRVKGFVLRQARMQVLSFKDYPFSERMQIISAQ